jgi:hypothetical protein
MDNVLLWLWITARRHGPLVAHHIVLRRLYWPGELLAVPQANQTDK